MTTIKDLSNLRGRRALITGAAGGLGRVMAATLAELGAELMLVDKPGADFTTFTDQLIQSWGAKVETRDCDLEQHDQRSGLMEWIKRERPGAEHPHQQRRVRRHLRIAGLGSSVRGADGRYMASCHRG